MSVGEKAPIWVKKGKLMRNIERKFEFILVFSSIKTPLLHHAASANTEAEGGRMVKAWDFEAGKKKKINLKRSNV